MKTIHGALAAAGIAVIDEGVLTGADHTVPYVLVPGSAAVDAWRALRAKATELGGWPVLLGPPDELERLEEQLEMAEGTIEETLNAAGTVKPEPKEWGADQRMSDDDDTLDDEPMADDEEIPADAEPHEGFSIPFNLMSGAPHRAVGLAWIPARESWEVPAHLSWGGWSECPMPEEHVAMLKSWNERYGAELVGLTGDVMELHVTRPPTTDAEALELAREQYAYCGDIVEQGVGTVGALAGSLRGASSWYFWWD